MRSGFKTRISHPSASPQAFIDTSSSSHPDLDGFDGGVLDGYDGENDSQPSSSEHPPAHILKLYKFASTQGNICDLLDESIVKRIGTDAVRQWEIDKGSRVDWLEQAERALRIAAQEEPDGDDGEKTYPFEGACLTLDTDVLTLDGWKSIADVTKKDFVYSRSPEGEAFYAPVTGTYRGWANELVHFKGKSIDLLTTTNHKMVVVSKNNSTSHNNLLEEHGSNHFFMEASEFLDNSRFYLRMPLTSVWTGEETPTVFGIPAYDYVRLLGWYLSEGSYATNLNKESGIRSKSSIGIAQSKSANPEKCELIEKLLEDCNISYSYSGNSYLLRIRSMNPVVARELRSLGNSLTKRIPRHALMLPSHLLKELLNSMILGDGHTTKDGARFYWTISKGLADDVQELCQKIGLRASIINEGKNNGLINGRVIEAKHDIYKVCILVRDFIDVAKLKRRLIPQRAEVACIETSPFHTFYTRRNGICVWTGNSNIHYPILTVATQQFAARALPALIRGDKVVGVKVFAPPAVEPSVEDQAKAGQQPVNNEQATEASVQLQAAADKEQQLSLQNQAKQARAERVKHYLNWLVFYQMPNWEGETDALLHETPVIGAGFKKIYRDENGFQSDYISATRLTLNNNAKSIYRCPRITWDFDAYPYEIEQKQRLKQYNNFEIPSLSDDPEAQVELIEQYRLEDLDDDGYAEPYIVTVYVRTSQVLRIEPAYTMDDITIDQIDWVVKKIDRWLGYSEFFFLPDPKGRYYGIGFGRLLEAICDSIDTSINQLIDAGNAEIAGGGFIAQGVRLQGSGQGGTLYQSPGEYQTVSTPGGDLKAAIWERTLPHPSQITFNLLELLLGAAKDIASVKDVITGNTPATAPVGTTLALQDQALQVFNAIYQRMYRGFHHEFFLLYKAVKRWATDTDKFKYNELTGGDLEADFAGDGTDIQPIADPAVVTKQQKIARIQTTIQFAESPVGMAAGMTQSGPAQQLAKEVLDALEWDRPERFLAAVQPNPEMLAKVQEMQASAQEKAAKAQTYGAGAQLDQAKVGTEQALAALHGSKAASEQALAKSHEVNANATEMDNNKKMLEAIAVATDALGNLHKLHRHMQGLPEENLSFDHLIGLKKIESDEKTAAKQSTES